MAKYSQRLLCHLSLCTTSRSDICRVRRTLREDPELAKEDRNGLLKSLQLLTANKRGWLQSAESLLLKYWHLLDVHRLKNSKDAIERAKAILVDDDAGGQVSQWIKRNYINIRFEGSLFRNR